VSHHHHDRDTHDAELGQLFTAEFWDERYGTADRIWSGNPNLRLVEHVADLAPGEALDVGCGEGADAVWLASRGWQVTGVDVSTVALGRAEAHAAAAGPQIAGRTTWQQIDILTWDPAPAQFDLVSVQFIHLPRPELASLLQRLGAAVRVGGTLLVVGHHPLDLETTIGRRHWPELLLTAEEIATGLDPDGWTMQTSAPERPATDPEGRTITIHEAVLVAVRR
jgi:SAM-dependent methyltransferase